MINTKQAKKYCREPIENIENYKEAISDTTKTWEIHHRDEIRVLPSGIVAIRSKEELIETGRYYGCPANELIFLTSSDHMGLHNKGYRHPMFGVRGEKSPLWKGDLVTEHSKYCRLRKRRKRESATDSQRIP